MLSKQQTKQYTATASLVFNNNQLNQQVAGLPATVSSDAAQTAQSTNVRLVALASATSTARLVGRGLTPQDVRHSLSISSEENTNIVNVAATSTSPIIATRIANIYSNQFLKAQQHATTGYFRSALALVNKQLGALSPQERVGPAGLALQDRAQSLGILSQIQSGNVQLAQAARIPTSPSSPKPVRNSILGGLLGLLFGLGLAFFLEWRNRQIREPEEAREVFGLPVLGTVPDSKAILVSNEGAVAELPFMENEAFRTLRASLRYFNVNREVRSVVVTSGAAREGKSTVAWNLARVAATSAKAIIVEADLRNPSLAKQHGLNMGAGLTELLTHQIDLDGAIQSKPITGGGNGSIGGKCQLDIISSGATPPNPAELLESQAMSDTLSQLTARYDLVVIDTAPTGVVSDAFPLLREVDGVIVVARLGQTTRDAAESTHDQLSRLDAHLLGIVANGVKLKRRSKYGYGYGYYGQETTEQSAPAVSVGNDS